MSGIVTTDPLTYRSAADVCWTRTNMAEVSPGVLVPLGWSFYGPLVDVSSRRGFAQLGVIPRSAITYPTAVEEHLIGVFHGRPVLNVTTLRAMMRNFPGVTGDDVERDILGSVRDGVVDRSYGWRLPAVAAKAGGAFLGSGKAARRVLDDTGSWWRTRFGPSGIIDGTPAAVALAEAEHHFGAAVTVQSRNRMLYQGASSQVIALAEAAGRPDLASLLLAAPSGIEEAAVAADLQQVANGRLDLDEFLNRHGFHGPNAGEITAPSWREDAEPLKRLIAAVQRSSKAAPARDDTARATAVAEVLNALPRHKRAGARAALRLLPVAARNLERSKVAFTMSLDGARAAARAIGTGLVTEGRLDTSDDAFFLFLDELRAPAPDADLRLLVKQRRETHEEHRRVELAENTWMGNPDLRDAAPRAASAADLLRGIGASAGEYEGTVKVVLDAGSHTTVEPGEVLVCPVTDPSWVSLMLVAGALVIDIGGTASHGAIIARELGVPCVIGTTTGTTDLRTGDSVRVNGATGEVAVLTRSQS